MGVIRKDITGKAYGKLTVVQYLRQSKHRHSIWECKCECGNFTEKTINSLNSGKVKSCSCYRRDNSKYNGMSAKREYNIWQHMINRCENHKSNNYYRYGGAGITVCERWHDFVLFLEDMGDSPSKNHSIDRIDGELGYFKENCKWATAKTQARNTKRNRIIEIDGIKRCLAEWVEIYGVRYNVALSRVHRGWVGESIFTGVRQ
jgi:hypothetical protein